MVVQREERADRVGLLAGSHTRPSHKDGRPDKENRQHNDNLHVVGDGVKQMEGGGKRKHASSSSSGSSSSSCSSTLVEDLFLSDSEDENLEELSHEAPLKKRKLLAESMDKTIPLDASYAINTKTKMSVSEYQKSKSKEMADPRQKMANMTFGGSSHKDEGNSIVKFASLQSYTNKKKGYDGHGTYKKNLAEEIDDRIKRQKNKNKSVDNPSQNLPIKYPAVKSEKDRKAYQVEFDKTYSVYLAMKEKFDWRKEEFVRLYYLGQGATSKEMEELVLESRRQKPHWEYLHQKLTHLKSSSVDWDMKLCATECVQGFTCKLCMVA